ncbi:MAG: ribosomal RNA small subunit methyltransferase A [Lentisphaerae bacterium]|nr:ribosomal RNA small subunit methyltransferase A [Lentisphaerota bacterium]
MRETLTMNKKELIEALESLGMRPGRGLGQNFLLDSNLLEWIVRNSGAVEKDNVLEVGPGFGALTEKMVAAGFNVTAIEFDHRLAGYLRKKFAGKDNFTLIEADACKVDFDELFPAGTVYKAVANLPYAISSVFIAKMIECKNPPLSMFFMLQKEMGERLAANCGTKAYGALSVRTQLLYDVAIDKIVPPQVFCPPPEVDSALVSFKLRGQTAFSQEDLKTFSTLVRALFNQRRKQLGKILGQLTGKDISSGLLEKCGFSAEIRPDKLTVTDYVKLAKEIISDEIKIRG